jgi:glycyl-tRNA synthetase beta chain
VSNLRSLQPDVVRTGNERVIRPRLTDAMFFWEQDKAKKLETRSETLKTVTFQNKLGSVFDKSARVATLAAIIAQQLGASAEAATRAARLSKCDLLTNMVNEFPELQGIMGEYYARHDGEAENVAIALREQYMPRFWGDELPTNPIGQALAIADKLDTLVGIFGIGQPPTGDKDPFGLRRAALGTLRITIECKLPLNIQQLLQAAQANFAPEIFKTTDGKTLAAAEEVFDFTLERLRGYYQDQNIPFDTIDAVLACRPTAPADADLRIRGVQAFRQLPQAESLAAANKRIHNILKKVETSYPAQASEVHFEDDAEKALFAQVQAMNAQITPFIQQGNYTAALQILATLREAVDSFFDKVMVMAENPTVRDNRLALLAQVQQLFLQIADISRLQG